MRTLSKYLREVITSVLPIGVLVTVLALTVARIDLILLGQFWIGALLLILGLAIFLMGADIGMQPMGEFIGSSLTRSRSVWFMSLSALILGTVITVAEPDLQVLASQVFEVSGGLVSRYLLIGCVSIGVGIFLVVGMLRIVFHIRLSTLLIVLYGIVFALAAFTSPDFLAVAFDSGGVTTGPMTVPFILSLGVGVSAVRGGKSSEDDSFGLVALSSVGPIASVLIMGIVYRHAETSVPGVSTPEEGLLMPFLHAMPEVLSEVALALTPLLVIFIAFQLFRLKMPKKRFRKILTGLVYTCIGLTFFLVGVNAGLMPAGYELGMALGRLEYNWILVPVGVLTGFSIVFAEPAVRVLNTEVERVTGGHIKRRAMLYTLSIGVALGVGLAMLRIVHGGISLWWYIIPGYLLALVLSRFVPQVFVGIAFDSGGVASGPMTATFLLALCLGAAQVTQADVLRDAFGVVAMVAMMPLLAIQFLGLIYKINTARIKRREGSNSEEEQSDG